jgi:hypothetical protein
MADGVTALARIRSAPVRISAGTSTLLTEVFGAFPQTLQTNSETLPQTGTTPPIPTFLQICYPLIAPSYAV